MDAYITTLINQLKQFEPHAQALDTIHNNYLTSFQQTAAALFAPDANFSGPASDNIAEILGNYLTAAGSLSDSMGTNISEMYGKSACSATAAAGELQDLWDSIKSSWFPEFTLMAAPDEMSGAIDGFSSSLHQYAGEPEPQLPATPQTPKSLLPPTPPSLTQEEDTAKKLFDEAKGDITYEEILEIVRDNPGLSMDQYRLLIQLRQKTGRLGVLLNNGFTTQELHDMIIAGFTSADIGTLVNRIQTALKNGTDRPGDPDGLTVQQIHDLAVNVADALNSGDPDIEFEGQTALSVLPDLVRFRKIYRWSDGSIIVDTDIETTHAIIEVTNAPDGKAGQIDTLLNNSTVNPRKKPVILFAPDFTPGAVKATERVDPDKIYYAKTWQQFKEWLILLGD